jgi:CRISPR-associated protein Cmr2
VAAATFRRGVIDAIENPQTIQSTRDGLFEAVRTLARAMSQLEETGVHVGRGKLPGLDGGNNLDLAWLAQVEGSWLFPDNWNPRAIARDNPGIAEGGLADLCEHGRVAAWQLIATSKAADLDPPAPYLAVLVQDADKMGDRLADRSGAAGSDLLQWHAAVSGALVEAARVQGQRLEKPDLLGWTIYAGGDDMLGFVPVRSSLAAVREVNASFVDSTAQALPRASASTALLFFHASSPLQSVLSAVRDLLAEAKEAGRPGLGIAALRRGGERVRLVRSWWADPPAPLDTPAVICLEALVEAMRAGLSGRLATALERDGQHLAALSEQWLASEVRRLVRRHSRDARGDGSNDRPTPEAVADSLLATAGRDPDDWQAPRAMVLARFIESVGG